MEVIKLSFTLKQITPMIHFQHNEEGATLRATELKPKLDRFILSWLAYDKEDIRTEYKLGAELKKQKKLAYYMKNNGYEGWFLDKKAKKADEMKIALNYKINITASSKNKEMVILDGDSYIGNADYVLKYNKGKYGSSFYDNIQIDFLVYDQKLSEKIIQLFPMLMDITAFGLQQRKGYGCFKVIEYNKNKIEHNIENNMKQVNNHFNRNSNNLYIYKLGCQGINKYKDALDVISKFNHIIKSGKNEKQNDANYIPSPLLKSYFHGKNINNAVNEKKAMKYCLNSLGFVLRKKEGREDIIEDCSKSNKYYLRGMLGFALEYSFLIDVDKCREKYKVNISEKDRKSMRKKFKISAEVQRKKFSRFPSPLMYHVYKTENNELYIYIIINNYSIVLLQELQPAVYFNEVIDKNEVNRRKSQNFKACIPSFQQFNIKDFFDLVSHDNNINTLYTIEEIGGE